MSIGFIAFLAFAGGIVGLIVLAARPAKRSAAKSEAYFVSMFPDLQEMARRYLAFLAPETPGAREKMAGWIRPPELLPTSASPASSP